MREFLQWHYEQQADWVKFAEAKNSAVAALLAAWGAFLFGEHETVPGPVQVALIILAMFVTACSFVPLLDRFVGAFMRGTTGNTVYFREVAKLKPEDYLGRVRGEYGGQRASAIDIALAEQVVALSRVAVWKFWLNRLALLAGVGAAIAGLLRC